MDDVAVLLEHVDLLNSLDGLDVQLLEGGLELLVVGISGPVDLLDLAAGSALASIGRKKQLVSRVCSRSSRWAYGVGDEFEVVGVSQEGFIVRGRVRGISIFSYEA